MSHQSANETLRPGGEGPVLVTVNCAYGQSIHTIISHIENGQVTGAITQFHGNVVNLMIGNASAFLNKEFRVFCTIRDVIDRIPGQAVEDVHLMLSVRCNNSMVHKTWSETTEGTGAVFTFSLDILTL